MAMPMYHPDFIVSCELRHAHLRMLIRQMEKAEAAIRLAPNSPAARNMVENHGDSLAAFMFDNCGFPKAQSPAMERYLIKKAAHAKMSNDDIVLGLSIAHVMGAL